MGLHSHSRSIAFMLSKRLYAIVLVFSLILGAISTPDIGIQQDWFTTPNGDLISFSGIISFNQNDDGSSPVSSLSDGQLVGLASKAYDEMSSKVTDQRPGAMAVLASNNEIFFASSIKNDRSNWLGIGTDQARPQVLIEAAGGARLSGSHRIGGHCGEINLMSLFHDYKRSLNFQGTSSRLVVWGTAENSPLKIFNPCSNGVGGGRYGCFTFLRAISNPQNPKAHLDDANLRLVPLDTAIDESWPDGLTFVYKQQRLSSDDKAAVCAMDDGEFDPNKP